MPGPLIFILSVMLFSVCNAQGFDNNKEYKDANTNNDTTESSEVLSTSVSTFPGEDFAYNEDVQNINDTITRNESSSTPVLQFSGILDGDSTTKPTIHKNLSTQGSSNESSTAKEPPGKGLTVENTHGWEMTTSYRSDVRKSSTTHSSTTKDKDSHQKASARVGLILGIITPILILAAIISAFLLRRICKTKKVDIKEHANAFDGRGENPRLQYMDNVQQNTVDTEQDPMIVPLDQTEPVDGSGDYIKLQTFKDESLNVPDAEQAVMNINGDQVKPPYTSHTDTAT